LGKPFLINKKSENPDANVLSKIWLWLVMGIVIAILGFFSFKMIQNSPKE